MDKGDVVRHLFQITCNMGRNQHRMLAVRDKIEKNIQNLCTDHRVQSTGRFIQNKKLCVVAQCHCKRELHLHAARKILEFLSVRQGKLLKILLILFLIPVLIDTLHDSAQMGNKESLGKGKLIENNADVLPVFCAASCMPKDGNTSTVR